MPMLDMHRPIPWWARTTFWKGYGVGFFSAVVTLLALGVLQAAGWF